MKGSRADLNRRAARRRWGANLEVLIANRFAFLSDNIKAGQRVLEIGAGSGLVRENLDGIELLQTDVEPNEWLDAVASGEALPFADGSFDAVVCIAALHHMDYPARALREVSRILRRGGLALVAEPHNSWLLRQLLALRGHEYIDTNVDPFGPNSCQRCGDSSDGNNAIGDLIFEDRARLKQHFPELSVVHHRYTECLLFVNSGGVDHKAPYIPLPRPVLSAIVAFDQMLCAAAPHLFALIQEVVLRRD